VSLVQIAGPPTAENSVIHLNAGDNIAVARVPLSPAQTFNLDGRDVTVREPIPPGHKVAVVRIEAGAVIRRYGQIIGRASTAIGPGQHVHTHNLTFEELAFEYEFPEKEIPVRTPLKSVPSFLGYPRQDGRAGTRNYIAVMAASNCAAHTAELIARSFDGAALPPNVDGVVGFPHSYGCGTPIGPDSRLLQRTVAGVLNHPNVASAVIVGLGCEVNQVDHYLGTNAVETGRLVGMTLQAGGGTSGTVEAARREIFKLLEKASAEKRVEVPVSKIVLGLNCGGSDSFSGITANPALGVCSDLLAEVGATAVLAETSEIFGAEHLLVKRARNRQVAEKLLGFIRSYKDYLARLECSFDDNPTPGNKAGGITNILEKSLGAAAKAGASTLMDAVDYAERIESPGFVFMNTPGYDPVSLAGLAAGGVNAIAFTSGRGSAIGFPSIPVIKISSNSTTYQSMRDNMDVNGGQIADGEKTVQDVGQEIFALLLRVASGERTASERLGHKEFVPWRIGPVV
jgi:altronate hydrolase